MAVLKGYIKANVEANAIKASDTIDAEIWMGSGYTKTPVQFKVKGGNAVPASSKDHKILEKAWDVDSTTLDGFIDWANDMSGGIDVTVSILTSTETNCLSTEDDSGEYVTTDKQGVEFYYCER